MIQATSPGRAATADRPGTIARLQPAWRRAILTVGVFLLGVLVLGIEAQTAPFEADEADYVATSRYYGYLFLQHDVTRSEWDSNHWTRTQPPLTRYIIGAWLTAYGYDLEKLNQPYVSTASSFEVNRQKGRVPTDEVLARARQPMVLLGAGAGVALFLLGGLIGGSTAGLVVVALALTSPFLRYTLVHAWAEAPLACFLVLAAWLASVGAACAADGRRSLWWAVGLGLALGLASATKLTGLVGIPIVVGTAALLGLTRFRAGQPAVGRALGAWALLAGAIALAIFVLVNPYLWRGPVDGILGMLAERRDEMAFQQDQWPEFAVLNAWDRPWLTAVGSTRVGPWAELPWLVTPLGLGLGALGVVAVVAAARRSSLAPALVWMMVAWLGGYTLAILAGLGLSYPRYFLPTCLLLLPFIGAGAATLVNSARAAFDRQRGAVSPLATRKS